MTLLPFTIFFFLVDPLKEVPMRMHLTVSFLGHFHTSIVDYTHDVFQLISQMCAVICHDLSFLITLTRTPKANIFVELSLIEDFEL